MKINNIEIQARFFAYDDCHKIYILENEENEKQAAEFGYTITPIDEIENTYYNSCNLRFIRNWNLDKIFAKQFENATFKTE